MQRSLCVGQDGLTREAPLYLFWSLSLDTSSTPPPPPPLPKQRSPGVTSKSSDWTKDWLNCDYLQEVAQRHVEPNFGRFYTTSYLDGAKSNYLRRSSNSSDKERSKSPHFHRPGEENALVIFPLIPHYGRRTQWSLLMFQGHITDISCGSRPHQWCLLCSKAASVIV